MLQSLTLKHGDVTISRDELVKALENLPHLGFSEAELGDVLLRQGVIENSDPESLRKFLQNLKRQGIIRYERDQSLWVITDYDKTLIPDRTLPFIAPKPLPILKPKSKKPFPFDQLLAWPASIALIGALITLNASLAWELGVGSIYLQYAFIGALIALDVFRPLLMARGFWHWNKKHYSFSFIAVLIALMLSPVSILSTTTMISSSMLLGEEINANKEKAEENLVRLNVKYDQLLEDVEKLDAEWVAECNRGGCGTIANGIEAILIATQAEADKVLEMITQMTYAAQEPSELVARMVETFKALRLFDEDKQVLLPLLLAISLEIAALFGPALLLTRKRDGKPITHKNIHRGNQ